MPSIAEYTDISPDSGITIDIMCDLQFFKKENFEECYDTGNTFAISEDVTVKILHINQLIEEKEKSQRKKDRIDAAELKKLYRN